MLPILIMINLFIYYVVVFISLVSDVCYHAYFLRLDLIFHCLGVKRGLTIPLEQTKDFRRTFKCLSATTVGLYTQPPSLNRPFETKSAVDEPQLSN